MPQNWLRGIDSNYRPQGYEPCELPTAPPRDIILTYKRIYDIICKELIHY